MKKETFDQFIKGYEAKYEKVKLEEYLPLRFIVSIIGNHVVITHHVEHFNVVALSGTRVLVSFTLHLEE